MNEQQKLAKLALEHHMYIQDWNMQNYLQNILEYGDKSNYSLSLISQNNQPVAVATLTKGDHSINVFVTPNQRGNNLGLKVVDQLLYEHNLSRQDVHAYYGEAGSENFFKRIGIACFEDNIPLSEKETQSFLNFEISYDELVKIKIQEKLLEYQNEANSKKKNTSILI